MAELIALALLLCAIGVFCGLILLALGHGVNKLTKGKFEEFILKMFDE